ncbi:MAG TPA: hypothetical protein VFH27_16890 [Longimicrobiaceae bacterium]|nr:hypothetical protein [Longimicrobiaceae bacterium]
MTRTRLRTALPLLAAALALAACGDRAPAPCAPAPAAVEGWQAAKVGPVTLRLPPGYVLDAATSPASPASPGEVDASWTAAVPGQPGSPARITLHVANDVDAADWVPADTTALHDRHACMLEADGRRGEVTRGWMADATSAGGRTYVTLAVWPGTGRGPGAALSMAAETAAEASRHAAAAASLRLR